MATLLHIDVSPLGEHSVSRKVSAEYLAAAKAAGREIITRDLAADPIPHLDAEAIFANYTPADQRSESAAAKFNYRLDLVKEITSVDEILISTPMWNWTIPSVLKAYFDQIIIPGVLDGSGAAGLTGKKVTFVVAQGGSYAPGAPRHGWDFATGYLELFAKALGATDVEVILAELTLAASVDSMAALKPKMEESLANALASAKERAAA